MIATYIPYYEYCLHAVVFAKIGWLQFAGVGGGLVGGGLHAVVFAKIGWLQFAGLGGGLVGALGGLIKVKELIIFVTACKILGSLKLSVGALYSIR
jgi:hypothetical protein